MSKRGRQSAPPRKKSAAPRAAQRKGRGQTRAILIIFVAVIAMTLPFAGKAFNVDEPLFIWAAQHAQMHPTDPYGFDVNWYGKADPMRDVMQNPPLTSYCIALAAAFVGWSEFGLHLVFSLFAVAAIAGTWTLATRLTSSPWLASAIAAFSRYSSSARWL
jgi:4-amino-4-deoxy-L-arabinose transferase-like glycosyltransferase